MMITAMIKSGTQYVFIGRFRWLQLIAGETEYCMVASHIQKHQTLIVAKVNILLA